MEAGLWHIWTASGGPNVQSTAQLPCTQGTSHSCKHQLSLVCGARSQILKRNTLDHLEFTILRGPLHAAVAEGQGGRRHRGCLAVVVSKHEQASRHLGGLSNMALVQMLG